LKKIGILSDTHGYFDTSLGNFFKECDEIWHAGDIGSLEVGKAADMVIWDTDNPAVLAYQIGANPCLSTMVAGEWRKNIMPSPDPS